MRKIFLLIVLITAVFTVSACNTEGGFDLTTETEIVVGLEAAYAPFNWATPTENSFTVPIANQSGFYADGFDVVMAQEIAGVDRNQLGAQGYDLSSYRSDIIAALDFVLSGI